MTSYGKVQQVVSAWSSSPEVFQGIDLIPQSSYNAIQRQQRKEGKASFTVTMKFLKSLVSIILASRQRLSSKYYESVNPSCNKLKVSVRMFMTSVCYDSEGLIRWIISANIFLLPSRSEMIYFKVKSKSIWRGNSFLFVDPLFSHSVPELKILSYLTLVLDIQPFHLLIKLFV